jgi:nitrogen regulatory protein PII
MTKTPGRDNAANAPAGFEITAIVKPYMLDALKQAFIEARIPGMTTAEVTGFGRQYGKTELYRDEEYFAGLLPKRQITVLVSADDVERVVNLIADLVRRHPGGDKIGAGIIYVKEVVEAIRIRTDEHLFSNMPRKR